MIMQLHTAHAICCSDFVVPVATVHIHVVFGVFPHARALLMLQSRSRWEWK